MDTKQIGNLTELQCLTRFYELGYSVSIPYGDSEKYDMILDTGKNLYRIQVKHGNVKMNSEEQDESLIIKTRWQSGYTKNSSYKDHKYSKNEIDFFATHYQGKNYLIPVEECSLEKTLRILPPKVKQPTIRYLKDYLDEEVLKDL
jgi:hypothetical protein